MPAKAKSRSTRTSIALPARRPSTSEDPVSAYAWDVISGKIVAGRLVRLACERHFRDIERGPKRGLYWRPDIALHSIEFYKHCRHSKGEWAGQPIKAGPWQQFIHGSAFGWVRADGLRRFRTIYEEVGRKNGKSTRAAAIALKGLVADFEPGADVYSAATKRDQAKIVFDEARKMVMRSPVLQRKVSIFRASLAVNSTMSSFTPLSADDKTLDGLNPHMIVVDELHKHKTRAVLDVLDTALGSRRQPLLWIITTAGDDNPETVYAQERAYAEAVLEGNFADDSWFIYIATLDKGDDWQDPKVWIKANPNLGVSVRMDDLKRQALAAKHNPAKQKEFQRLRLNLRTSSTTQAITAEMWDPNTGGPFDPAEMHGRSCFAGLDISSKIDLSAFVKLFPPLDHETRWRIVPRFWMPADTVEQKADRDRVQYQRWIDNGLIEVTPGNVVDQNEVQAAVIEDARLHNIVSCAFDPWNATQLSVSLADAGVEMVEFIQGIRSYTAPMKELIAWLLAGQLDHGDNPVLRWMALNLRVRTDANDNWAPTKKLSIGRIDGIAALTMALGRAMLDEPSAYADGSGLTTF